MASCIKASSLLPYPNSNTRLKSPIAPRNDAIDRYPSPNSVASPAYSPVRFYTPSVDLSNLSLLRTTLFLLYLFRKKQEPFTHVVSAIIRRAAALADGIECTICPCKSTSSRTQTRDRAPFLRNCVGNFNKYSLESETIGVSAVVRARRRVRERESIVSKTHTRVGKTATYEREFWVSGNESM